MKRVLIAVGALAIVGLALPRRAAAPRQPAKQIEAAAEPAGAVMPERARPVSAEAAVAREMARCVGAAIGRKAPAEELQACYDAIRRGGPASVPEMVAALDDPDPCVRMAAIQALSGLRYFYSEAPRLIADGLTVEAIARRFRVPSETVIAVLGDSWSTGATDAMARASKGLAGAGMREDVRRDAISSLTQLCGESAAARTALAVVLADLRGDVPMRRYAFQAGIAAIAAADAVAIALDPAEGAEWRLQAGLACARTETQLESLRASLGDEARRTALDRSSESRAAAVELVARLEPEQASAFLVGLLRDDDQSARLMALQALVNTRRADQAVDAIKAVAEDPRGGVASLAARRVLGRRHE